MACGLPRVRCCCSRAKPGPSPTIWRFPRTDASCTSSATIRILMPAACEVPTSGVASASTDKWSTAEVVPPPINTKAIEVYPADCQRWQLVLHIRSARAASGAAACTERSGCADGKLCGACRSWRRPSTVNPASETSSCLRTKVVWSLHPDVRQISAVVTSSCPSGAPMAGGASRRTSARPSTPIRWTSVRW